MKALTMIANAAYVYGLTLADLRGDSRCPNVSEARQLAVYILRRDAGLSYPGIGKLLNRNHSTTMYLHGQAALDIAAGRLMASKLDEYDKAVGK